MGNPNENKNAKANTSQFHFYEVPHHNIIPCSERWEFQNNLSCSVPNHDIYNPDYQQVVQKLSSLHDFSPNIFTFQKKSGGEEAIYTQYFIFEICNFLIVAISSAEISCMNAMTQLFLTLFDAGTVKAGVCQGKKQATKFFG